MGSKPKTVYTDPAADAQKAADMATQKANAEAAARKTRRQRDQVSSALGSAAIDKQSVLGMGSGVNRG